MVVYTGFTVPDYTLSLLQDSAMSTKFWTKYVDYLCHAYKKTSFQFKSEIRTAIDYKFCFCFICCESFPSRGFT